MGEKILSKLPVLLILLSILTSFFVYKPSFNAYFFQDDWFTLKISSAKNIGEFLHFFIPGSDVIYYRPLGMQVPFFILKTVFGINPLPFHILTFITHAINITLVFFLIRLLKKDDILASICAFLYGVSAVFYIPAYWFATYAFILGPTFFFLSFILFILYLHRRNKIHYLLSGVSFILGLLTNEILIFLPFVLVLYQIYASRKALRILIPYFSAAILLIITRFVFFAPPISGYYQLGIGRGLISNLRAYLVWSFNWPEEMKAQFINIIKINPLFIRDFPWYFAVFVATFFVSIILFYVIPIIFWAYERNIHFRRLTIFCCGWFVVCLLPVLFFTQHSFAYYLPISLVGLLFLSVSSFKYLADIIYKRKRSVAIIMVIFLLANWTVSALVTAEFNSKIHWAPKRAVLSKSLIDHIRQNPDVLRNHIAYIPDSSENKLALNGQDALQVIYNDNQMITIYGNKSEK